MTFSEAVHITVATLFEVNMLEQDTSRTPTSKGEHFVLPRRRKTTRLSRKPLHNPSLERAFLTEAKVLDQIDSEGQPERCVNE
jgi:hypothetical protein